MRPDHIRRFVRFCSIFVCLIPMVASAALDTDGDLLPDVWEFQNGYDYLDQADAGLDIDGDGLNGTEEYNWGTRGNKADSDSDTLADGREVVLNRDPKFADLQIDAGFFFSCALSDSGVTCWGRNQYGQTDV